MSRCTKCGTNFVGTPENPAQAGLCKYCEIQELRAKVTELEAQCGVMREALREADMHISSFYIDWSKFNHGNPDYDPSYKPEFPPVVAQIQQALKPDAGRDLLAKMERMETALKKIVEDGDRFTRGTGLDSGSHNVAQHALNSLQTEGGE